MPKLTPEIANDPEARREWIKYQLRVEQGTSVAAIAKEHGMGRRNLYVAFVRPFPRAEKILADALGVTPKELFPERYDQHGLPTRRRANNSLGHLANSKHTRTAAAQQSPEVSS